MGVPGLYKCLVRRYPLIQQDISNLPTFDYFYIDLNGVIHQMSHATEELRRTRNENEIFFDICDYIDSLLKIVNPQKVLFLCVDGVAPLAKIIQQRSRRYKCKEYQSNNTTNENDIIGHYKINNFNRNCITPGTQFMEDFHQYLLQYIDDKSKYDYSWKSIKIVYSGYNIPGEGEHKIMDFIRSLHSNSLFDINSTHCFHGLDADLILLGLVTHLKNVAILRENQSVAGKIHLGCQMRMLYISILRDYIQLEFSCIEKLLHFQYNFDRILNDWILLACLIGNDFIPNIPFMYIRSGGLFFIWDIYKKTLPLLDDYLTKDDHLNIDEFIKFMSALSIYENDHRIAINSRHCDDDNLLKINNSDKYNDYISMTYTTNDVILNNGGITQESDIVKIDPPLMKNDSTTTEDLELSPLSDVDDADIIENISNLTISKLDACKQSTTLTDNENMKSFKIAYYNKKLHLDYNNIEDLKKICYDYVTTVSWILQYYSSGLRNWRFVYPHHYSPFISDIASFDVDTYRMTHFKTYPIEPFTQLLCVQPPASVYLLPTLYQKLMIDYTTSPIIDIFPTNFINDLNGKMHEFESVVLLPFISIDRIIKSVEQLTIDNHTDYVNDIKNQIGHVYLWKGDSNVFKLKLTSKNLNISKIINKILLDKTIMHPLQSKLRNFECFPSFNGLSYSFHYRRNTLRKKFFYSIIIDINNTDMFEEKNDIEYAKIYTEYMNKIVYCDFPYSRLGVIKEIIFKDGRLLNDKSKKSSVIYQTLNSNLLELFTNLRSSLSTYYQSIGIKLGRYSLDILFRVHYLTGFKYIPINEKHGILRPQWDRIGEYYPSNIVIIEYMDEMKKLCYNSSSVTFDSVFEPNAYWIAESNDKYQMVVKLTHFNKQGIPRCKIKVPQPVVLGLEAFHRPLYSNYMTIKSLSQMIQIHTATLLLFLSKINVKLSDSWTSTNIGLDLYDRSNELEIPGFSLYYNKHFLVSSDVRDTILNYKKKFNALFEYIEKAQLSWDKENGPFRSGLSDTNFYNKTKCDFWQVMEFLKLQPSFCMQKYNYGSISMDNCAINELDKFIKNMTKPTTKLVIDFISPISLNYPFKPSLNHYSLSKSTLSVRLLDRVVITARVAGIPLGADGFVVSINTSPSKNPKIPINHPTKLVNIYVEIVLTKPHRFTSKFSGRITNSCIIPYDWTFNMSNKFMSNIVPNLWLPYFENRYIDYNKLLPTQNNSTTTAATTDKIILKKYNQQP